MTNLPLRRALLVFVALVTVLTGTPATAIAATTATKVSYATNVSERSIVTGDLLRVYVRTYPVTPKVTVRLYSRPKPTAAWTFRAKASTPASGRLTFSLRPTASGILYLKIDAVAPGATTPVSRSVPSVSVWPPTPVGTTRTGPDLIALRLSFCLAIGNALKTFAPLGGPAYAAAVTFASTTYKQSNCYNRSISQSLWAGLVDALWAYGVDKFLDGAADAAWGPLLDALLSKVRLTAIGLDQVAKNLFNSWLLQDVQRVLDNAVECFRTHKFPALECAYAPAENALLAKYIH